MDISNPNFNVLLMTPGRTGSHMIIHFFKEMTGVIDSYRTHRENRLIIGPKILQHSHTPKDINLSNDHTYFILNTRNLVETVISYKIATVTGNWVIRNNPTLNIIPIFFDLKEFQNKYNNLIRYYKEISSLIPNSTKIVDYLEFKDNIHNLFKIFDIPKKRILRYNYKNTSMIFKTTGTHKDWILNYDEIIEFGKSLEQNPLNIIKEDRKTTLLYKSLTY